MRANASDARTSPPTPPGRPTSRDRAVRRPVAAAIPLLLAVLAAVSCGKGESTSPGGNGTAAAGSGPSIRFPETLFDFGTIYQHDNASHTFRFDSVGSEPVRITHVKTDCACTIPLYTKKPVEPGQSGEVTVTFNAGSRHGAIDKELSIDTDDPENPRVKLRVKGTVKREFWIEPGRILLDSLRPGVPVGKHRIHVRWLPEVNLEITSIETTDPSIRILDRQPFESETSRGVDVTVTVENWEEALKRANASVFSHFVVVKTDHPKYAQVTVPVTGGRFEPVRWEPKVLMLGVIRQGEEVEKTVTLSTPRGIDLEIEKLEGPEFIEMSVVEPESDSAPAKPGLSQTVVRIRLLGSAPRGSFKEHLKIFTNLEEKPEIAVYVFGKIE